MRRRLGLLLLLAAGCAAAAELTPQDFAFGVPLQPAAPAAVHRTLLPADVYRRAVRPDLGDLRVFNAGGEPVPHVLRRPAGESAEHRPPVRLALFALRGEAARALDAVRVTIESGRAAVDVQAQGAASARPQATSYVLDARALEGPLAALQLEWPESAAQFAGRMSVEASEDLGTWRSVAAAAPVANLRVGAEQLVERRIAIAPTRARFWRLTWVGDPAPFELTGVQAEPAALRTQIERASLTLSGLPLPDRPGELEFDLGGRFPVDRLDVELPETNTVVQIEVLARASEREPWRVLLRRGFYRLRRAEVAPLARRAETAAGRFQPAKHTSAGELRNAPVELPVTPQRHWLLRIDRAAGGLGAASPRLTVAWIPHELLFVPRGEGPFVLAYGSGSVQPASGALGSVVHELTRAQRDGAGIEITEARAGEPFALGGERRLRRPRDLPWRSALLWSTLVLGVLLLGWMAWRLSKELGSPPPRT